MAQPANSQQSTALRQIALDAPQYSKYKPLDTDNREIRLLDISPGLDCQLRHASLDDKPGYSALSYYWGPSGDEIPIAVNGEDVAICMTLHHFLLSLLELCGTVTVWLDVLCMNQRDIAEQSAQVSMMGDIYVQADCVYSWLGQGEPDTDYAISYLKGGEGAQRTYNLKIVQSGMEQMFARRYWTRVWIIQECLLNKNVFVVCGDKSVELDATIDAFFTPDGPRSQLVSPSPPLSYARSHGQFTKYLQPIVAGRQSSRIGAKEPLLKLAMDFTESECQDPRDRFYAFRELAQDGHDLQVDYSCSPLDILLQASSRHNWSCFLTFAREHPSRGNVATRPATGSQKPWAGTYWSYHFLVDMWLWPKRHESLSEAISASMTGLRIQGCDMTDGLADSSDDWLVHGLVLCPDTAPRPKLWKRFQRMFQKLNSSHLASRANFYDIALQIVPTFERGIHSLYVSCRDFLFVVVESSSGTVVSACIGSWNMLGYFQGDKSWFGPGEFPTVMRLQATIARKAKRHIWACNIVRGVHTSRLFMFLLVTLASYGSTIKPYEVMERLLAANDTGADESPIGRCRCVMPEGLRSPLPPPWAPSKATADGGHS